MNNAGILYISPEYLCLVNDLIKQKDNAKTLSELKKIFTDFAKKYTPITYLFQIWKNAAESFKYEKCFSKSEEDINNLLKGYFENSKLNNTVVVSQKIDIMWDRNRSGYCWYRNPSGDLGYLCLLRLENLHVYQEDIERFKELIQIPHRNMEFTFKQLKKNAEYPLNAEMLIKYKKALELHQKIIEADENLDHDKWFKYLLESNDQKCIKRNILYRISTYPFVEKLWKLYIEYLESTNLQMMLKIYKRYCRLFIKDKSMLEKYRIELQKLGSQGICVTKFWIDTIEFERCFVSANSAGKVLNRALKSFTPGPKGLIRYAKRFYKNNPECIKLCNIKRGEKSLMEFDFQYQKNNFISTSCIEADRDYSESFKAFFSSNESQIVNQILENLPTNLIFNIIGKSSISLLIKLLQTCKYYNKILRILTCHKLRITDETEFGMHGQTLFLPASKTLLNFKAIFLTNSLNVTSKIPNLLSDLLPKFTTCNIRFLYIHSQRFSFKEYKFLTKYGNIESLGLEEVNIFDENGSVTSMEKIMSLVPKACDIVLILPNGITCDSPLYLSGLQCKIKYLCIGKACKSFNVKFFCDFIMKYCDIEAEVYVFFKEETDRKFELLLLKTWKSICKLSETFNGIQFCTAKALEEDYTILTIHDVANDDIF